MIEQDHINRYYGIYRAVVSASNDPTGQRRLKLVVPQIHGNEVTAWAWPIQPSNMTIEVPTVGQGIWAMFVGGDPEFPVWFGEFGTHKGSNKKVIVKPLPNSTSLVGTSNQVITTTEVDGSTEIDLTNSLVAMAKTGLYKSSTTPTHPTSTGTPNTYAYDGTHFYVCIAANTWIRINADTSWS